MESVFTLTDQLNACLQSGNPCSPETVKSILLKLRDDYLLAFRFIDFTQYTEEKLEHYAVMKKLTVTQQNFEKAACFRDLETECLRFLDMKKENHLTRSTIVYDSEFLVYCYLGTEVNDEVIREEFNLFSKKQKDATYELD